MNRLKHDEFETNLSSSLEADSAADHNQEAVPIPDGMEAFLDSIDTCFADPSFWNGL